MVRMLKYPLALMQWIGKTALLASAILLTSPSGDGVLLPNDAHLHALLTPRTEDLQSCRREQIQKGHNRRL